MSLQPTVPLRAPVAPAAPATRLDRRRALVLGLATGGAGLFGLSYLLPWWSFRLVAPQYPAGLSLSLALTGVTGDVKEIDILNHYIGMRSMSGAASLETELAPWLVTAVALTVVAAVLAAGRRLGWLALAAAVGLPLGFVADTTWWMYRFGHELDPHAPLKFRPFMPTLLGDGTIGQFHTTAWPAAGFWVALAAAGMVGVAVALRKRVCDSCPANATCGAACRQLLFRVPL